MRREDPFVEAEQQAEESRGLPEFLLDPIGVLRRRWPWMLTVLLAGVVATLLFAYLQKPRYAAEATVLISNQRIPEDFVRTTVREDPFERINAMVGESLVREKLLPLVEAHDLYPELRDPAATDATIAQMRRDIRIEPEKGVRSRQATARLFTVGFEAEDPVVAASVANEVAGFLIEASRRIRSRQASLTTEFLRRELEKAEGELREQSGTITDFKQRHSGELPVDLEPSLRRLERLQQERQSLALQLAEAETRIAMLATGEETTSPNARLLQLRAELAAQLSVHTERHPDVVALKLQIERLEEAVLQAALTPDAQPSRPSLMAGSRRTLEELRRQLVGVDASVRKLEMQVARIPGRQEELRALEEKESVVREQYLEFLRKVQDAELAQNLESEQQGERVSLLESAEPPSRPSRSRARYLGAGLILSLASALGLGFLLELLDPVVLTPRQVESFCGLPVLGSVPRL